MVRSLKFPPPPENFFLQTFSKKILDTTLIHPALPPCALKLNFWFPENILEHKNS